MLGRGRGAWRAEDKFSPSRWVPGVELRSQAWQQATSPAEPWCQIQHVFVLLQRSRPILSHYSKVRHHYSARVFWNRIMMSLPSFLNPLLPFCQAVLGQGARLLPYRSMAFICPLPSFLFRFSFFFFLCVFCFVFKLQHCLANGLGVFSANTYILNEPIPITLPSFFEEPGPPVTSNHESLLAFTALLAFLLGPWK